MLDGTQSQIRLRPKRAASYLKTPIRWRPSIPTILSIVFSVELMTVLFIPDILKNRAFILLVGLSIPIGGWLFVYWQIYLSVFTTPLRDLIDVKDERWKDVTFRGWGEEELIAKILPGSDTSRDLVVYLHGYSSSLGRGESRCLHLNSLGPHIIGLDQRGFGRQEGRFDWTILKAVADAEALLEEAPKLLGFEPERVWIYGHSLGGFITIRLASHLSDWWEHKLKGIILESPVTSFPMIIDEKLPGRMVMAKPWVRHTLRREYERIHPDLNVRYANSELPYWGLPKVDYLLVQAEEDETLGLDHYELAIKHLNPEDSYSSIHLIEGMVHTSTEDSAQRAELVENWLVPVLGE